MTKIGGDEFDANALATIERYLEARMLECDHLSPGGAAGMQGDRLWAELNMLRTRALAGKSRAEQ